MAQINEAGTYSLGDRLVHRMGYGAMQLARPHAFGPPKDRAAAPALPETAMATRDRIGAPG